MPPGRSATGPYRSADCPPLLALAAHAAPAPVRAQAPQPAPALQTAEPAGYAALIDDAIGEYAGGRFEEARALFARAHAMFPNARTLRGLGMVAFELRNYAECVQQLELALAASVRPLSGSLRLETEGLLARARGFVGRFTLVRDPPELGIAVDDVPLQLPAGQPLDLDAGGRSRADPERREKAE